ncbi:DNA methyltransferase [Isosphaeraceae bacterium EP7]
MPSPATILAEARPIPVAILRPNPFSVMVYGDPASEIGGLIDGVRDHGILVPLVVSPAEQGYELISGHRRLACALTLGLTAVPCEIRVYPDEAARREAVIEYNRQRRKSFTQKMREADAVEILLATAATARRLSNLNKGSEPNGSPDRLNSDGRAGRTDSHVAELIGLGGKDLFRQARAVWKMAGQGDPRARSGVALLDLGEKSIHAAYKDLRRRDRFTSDFRPTPYDVWKFRHDRAYGVPHPGSIPPGIVAHAVHYFAAPGALVVDPMAGGGVTPDVCAAMGRRCLAYDLNPAREDIAAHDIRLGFPEEARDCDLIFCDPPYHTMLSAAYAKEGVSNSPLDAWTSFLKLLAGSAYAALRPGGYLALLLANQTEKDLPAGHGYLDHVFLGYQALTQAGFLPERRIHCPMDGAYLPQHVRRARVEGRMLGQVRDLLVMRKPLPNQALPPLSS